jgi:hypothetical protein
MNKKNLFLILIVFFFLNASVCDISNITSDNDKPYVKVYLKSGGIEKFQYDRFYIDGNAAELDIRKSNCVIVRTKKNEVNSIYYYGKTWSNCDKRTRREFKIYYKNTSVQGHQASFGGGYFHGYDFDNGEHKTGDLDDISKVLYSR